MAKVPLDVACLAVGAGFRLLDLAHIPLQVAARTVAYHTFEPQTVPGWTCLLI